MLIKLCDENENDDGTLREECERVREREREREKEEDK